MKKSSIKKKWWLVTQLIARRMHKIFTIEVIGREGHWCVVHVVLDGNILLTFRF